MKKITLLILACVLGFAFQDQNTGTLTGIVTDSATGEALIGANIIVKNTSLGAATDLSGKYVIKNIPPGKYDITFAYIGYTKVEQKDISIKAGSETTLNAKLIAQQIQGETVVVTAQAKGQQNAINQQLSSNKISNIVSQERIQELPDATAAQSISRLPGVSTKSKDGKVVIRGIAPKYNSVIVNGVAPAPAEDYVVQDEFNTESYDKITENEFLDVLQNPLSTFSIDVDVASYGNMRRFVRSGSLPPMDAVRTEEFINYFSYSYPEPTGKHPFSINTEIAPAPWNPKHHLMMVGLQGKHIAIDKLPPANLVFLLDVSGSMDEPNKLPLVKSAFHLLVNQLRSIDRVAIVVYAGAAGLVLPSTSGDEKVEILDAIDNLQAGGSTAGGAGINLAYKIAKENFLKDGNNRVILATDGDFNIGASSDGEMERLIEEKRNDGIYLSVLGFGMGNYKDSKMEKLADKGNGNYAYIDNILEAKKVFVGQLAGTLYTIAKDVKLQIEFNPAKVKAYRLIGYENRLLNKEDFNNDKKDAGDMGAGHSVTAFYEIVPVGVDIDLPNVDSLKYQRNAVKMPVSQVDEMLTIKIRYKPPKDTVSILQEVPVLAKVNSLDKTSNDYQFATSVVQFCMILRESKYLGNTNYDNVLESARVAKGEDKEGYRSEFIQLVEMCKSLPKRISGR